jgi:hypothetical protein
MDRIIKKDNNMDAEVVNDDAKLAIRNALKNHPRWDPLQNESPNVTFDFTTGGISYTIRVVDKGLFLYARFPESIGRNLYTPNCVTRVDDYSDNGELVQTYAPKLIQHDARQYGTNPYTLDRCLLCHMPPNGSEFCFYDPFWIWNKLIPGLISYDDPNSEIMNGARLFNIYLTLNDDDEVRHVATRISVTKERITFEVQSNIKLAQGVKMYLKGASNPDFTIVEIPPNMIVWNQNDGRFDFVRILYDSTTGASEITITTSNILQEYLLSVFQRYILGAEMNIVTLRKKGSMEKFIAPRTFCTRVTLVVDCMLQIAFHDTVVRVTFSDKYGFMLSGQQWNVSTSLLYPKPTLQRMTNVKLMKMLKALEQVPIERRNDEQWDQIERISKILRHVSSQMYIECAVCSEEAKFKTETGNNYYCSKECAIRAYK